MNENHENNKSWIINYVTTQLATDHEKPSNSFYICITNP